MKQNMIRILSVMTLLMTLWYFNEVLNVSTMHGSSQARAMYYQPRNKIDVAILGSSHVHCDIDPGLLWNEYGMTAYDYSAAEQPLWITYYYLKELCRYQKPGVVVLELYAPARFKDDYQYEWLNENLCGMRFSINKIGAVIVGAEREKIKDYFPSFTVYHNRMSTLTKDDFLFPFKKRQIYSRFKGFVPFQGQSVQERPEPNETYSGGLTLKSEIYLKKIIDYTKKNDIELYLIVSPYIIIAEDEIVYNRIQEIADSYGLQFSNFNYEYDKIGLDFSTDFYEKSHLNYLGAEKYTRYLGSEIKTRYCISDHRGEKGYEAWE